MARARISLSLSELKLRMAPAKSSGNLRARQHHGHDFAPHFERCDCDPAKNGGQRGVGRVAAPGDDHGAVRRNLIAGVKEMPGAAEMGLETGVKVHRIEPGGIAADVACRNVERTAERDGQVGIVAANALAQVQTSQAEVRESVAPGLYSRLASTHRQISRTCSARFSIFPKSSKAIWVK